MKPYSFPEMQTFDAAQAKMKADTETVFTRIHIFTVMLFKDLRVGFHSGGKAAGDDSVLMHLERVLRVDIPSVQQGDLICFQIVDIAFEYLVNAEIAVPRSEHGGIVTGKGIPEVGISPTLQFVMGKSFFGKPA